MFLKHHRLLLAAALFATCLVALFGGCGLSTHGTATNTESRCTASSQCNDDQLCTTDECTAEGVCTHTAMPDGDGPPSTQVPGSCQKSVCKAGLLAVVNDDLNVSDDGEFCTADDCKDGKPAHPQKPDTTECKVGQATGHCTAGKYAVECGVGLPPCDDKNACTDDSCDVANGKCVFSPLDGVKIPGVADKPGDCRTPRCIGGAAVETAFDDTDLPVTTSDCVTPTCAAGTPSLPPLPTGQTCATSSGTVCDGNGACVACNVEADCTNVPKSNECRTRTCNAHACATDFVPADTALVAQSPGDCQVIVCDGAGAKVSKADDKDLPVDGNDCRDHLCVAGAPQTPPLVLNTKCGVGQAFYCDGNGGCVGCTEAKLCNGVDDDCKTRTCVNNTCGFAYQPDGTALPVGKQKTGDCQELQCNGAGNVKSFAFDTDLPNDANDCTKDVCASGIASNPALAADTLCAVGYCDGQSACVQCTKAAQCPNAPLCVTATCNSNVCGTSNVAAGTLAPAGQQVPADCKDAVCDGNGGKTTQPNVGDLPNDNNQCTSDACTAQGIPSFVAKASHTVCTQNNGKVCDGNGACIGCVDNADCTAPGTCGGGNPGTANVCGCTKKTCAQQQATCGTPVDGCNAGGTLLCNDGAKNGAETDVDCGGNVATCTVRCAQGKACSANSDCSSGFCADGVCCNAACTGAACKACSQALNGVADGQCLDAKVGSADPRGVCAAGDVCATNAKCRCADSLKNGLETDADCGGGVCPKCMGGKACSVANDCGTTFCADGFCCDKACNTACVACSKALSGATNGTCGNIPAGNAVDPVHGSCTNVGDVCGTAGACRCADLGKDGLETDVDCGGVTCAKCAQGKACSANTDCGSGFCVEGVCCNSACSGSCQSCLAAKNNGANGTCGNIAAGQTPKTACAIATDVCGTGGQCRCGDGAKDGTETDIDCGGSVCGKCGQGKVCSGAGDCSTAGCVDGFCCDQSLAACSGCKACSAALTGGTSGTCGSVTSNTDPHNACSKGGGTEMCGTGGLCSCADGLMNGAETDLDCGGAVCGATCAVGKACNAGTDCSSAVCQGGKCVSSLCGNLVKDGAETDIDCGGGTCQKCPDAKKCGVDGDCVNATCISGTCYPATCRNTAKDGLETDVDCGGGACPTCAGNNKHCTGAGDCASGFCADTYCCNAACGGCQACSGALTGGTNGQCAVVTLYTDPHTACAGADACGVNNKCQCADSAENGTGGGTETDVDCGGSFCAACVNGKKCALDGDCSSGFCNPADLLCYAATCKNTTKDGLETDVDCGGGTCPKCALGLVCAINADCTSGNCNNGNLHCQ